MLGTFVEISAGGMPPRKLHEQISEAYEEIEKVQSLMSFHDSQSEVSRLNREAHRHSVAVHPWTYRVLKTALKISRQTRGRFDCAVGDSLIRMGYLPGRKNQYRRSGSFKDIRLLASNRVKFNKPLMIDLGGIAKGFAVDCAVRFLKRRGIPWGCVNAGGDLRVFGKKAQKIYLRLPGSPQTLIELRKLKEKAISTSGIYFSRRENFHRQVSPMIAPKEKTPFLGRESVSVIAATCMIADALTKAVMLAKKRRSSVLALFKACAVILVADAKKEENEH